jgi:hypothetical protein
VLKQRPRAPAPALNEPRTVAEVLGTALKLYVSYAVLFIGLSMAVVVPYELIVLAVAHASPLGQEHTSAGKALILSLIQIALVAPLVSALQVRAVQMIGEHERPRFIDVIRRSLPTLPVVVAADIIAGLGIGIGLILLIIPGVILALRWAVVAQVAAIEKTDWPGALKRSAQLTSRNYLRILAILVCVSIVNLTLTNVGAAAIGTRTRPAEVAAGIAIAVLQSSFQALTIAVLYFDLRAREQRP